jgi:hypothetical protein
MRATGQQVISRRMISESAFFGVAALLFGGSAAVTILWSASMSAMGVKKTASLGAVSRQILTAPRMIAYTCLRTAARRYLDGIRNPTIEQETGRDQIIK